MSPELQTEIGKMSYGELRDLVLYTNRKIMAWNDKDYDEDLGIDLLPAARKNKPYRKSDANGVLINPEEGI